MTQPNALIVDDENDICFLLGKVLKEKNYNVVIANTLREGFIKLEEVKPDVLFLDIRLPDGLGLDAISSIRKSHPKLKIIVMSAHDGAYERNKAKEDGADLFLSKPLNTELIKATLPNSQ